MKTQPSNYVPTAPDDFIGGAKQIAAVLAKKAKALNKEGGTAKLLLYGPPGCGKTRLAEMFANQLAGHSTMVESVNGRNVDIHLVRKWQESCRYANLFGGWSVKIINELDTCPPASQDLLLTYLDEMPSQTAFIGTSNLDLRQLVERFQTRMQQFRVKAPEHSEIEKLLQLWKIPKARISEIVVGCGGNVRAALLDAQSIVDVQSV